MVLSTRLFNHKTRLTDYRSDVWRVVESQEDAATLHIVDDHAEQVLLEELLDQAKPPYRANTQGMHYLLKTAFRYPPLKWGSRFGTSLMPSYFYASELPATALCECAYYRFLLLHDMRQPYQARIRSEYVLFKVLLDTNACLDLTADKYESVRAQLRDAQSYGYSQSVGRWAYEHSQIELIRFHSARTRSGVNVAVAEPSVIRSRKPSVQQRWLCLTKSDSVSFSSRDSTINYVFKRNEFCDDNDQFMKI